MSRILDVFAQLTAPYRRLVRGERFALNREQEWLFAVQGSAEDFETRFNDTIAQTSRDDFFRLSSWTEDHQAFGFCRGDEVALKVSQSQGAGIISHFWPVYHFHGSLFRSDGQTYLCGHNRADRLADWAIHSANLYYLLCGAWLIKSLVATSLGWPTTSEADGVFAVMLEPLFITAVWTLVLLVYARIFEGWARPVHEETYKLLTQICGSPGLETDE